MRPRRSAPPKSPARVKASRIRGASAAIALAALLGASRALAQEAASESAIPPNLTQLRPIQCIAYDPKPSDFKQNLAYFDSDFFNSDFTGIWGDDGKAGARKDLAVFAGAGLNLLHIYNWNAQRTDHTAFLNAAQKSGIKVMIPISNFTALTITGRTGCPTCPSGYRAAFELVRGIFEQVYPGGSRTPHPAAAMWSIYNEYDLNQYDPVDVAFVAQAILTLEDRAGIAAADRLPITAPVSDATWNAQARRDARMAAPLNAALERAAAQWLQTNPGKNVSSANPPDLPGGVLAMLAISNALSDGQHRSSFRSSTFDPQGPQPVSVVPADFWRTRWIATSNPFRLGPSLVDYLQNRAQFQSAWPGTTAFDTLPPLFFGEMGYSQRDAGNDTARQAEVVLGQIRATAPLARDGSTPEGYFLGSCFFQHTFVDESKFQAFDTTGTFETRPPSPTAPCPACGKGWRVDGLRPLPVWNSVTAGYDVDGSRMAVQRPPDGEEPILVEPGP